MPVISCGTKELEINFLDNKQYYFGRSIIGFCHKETDYIIIYNENNVILFETKDFIQYTKNISAINWPIQATDDYGNVYHPVIQFENNILFCVCLSETNDCLLLIKNLNNVNGLYKPWQVKYMQNEKGQHLIHRRNINIFALTLCIAKVGETDEISFRCIYYDKFRKSHHSYTSSSLITSRFHENYENFIIKNLQTNIFNDEDIYNYSNATNNMNLNNYRSEENAHLLSIEKLDCYLYIRGGCKTIYKISTQNAFDIQRIVFPNDNDNNDNNNNNNTKKMKLNVIKLCDHWINNVNHKITQIYTRPLHKKHTSIIPIKTSSGIVLIEMDLLHQNLLFFIFNNNNNNNNIMFHAHYKCYNDTVMDYAWKSGEYIKLIHYKTLPNDNNTFIAQISLYDLIPKKLLWKLQTKNFILLQNFLSVKYSFPHELIDLLCQYLNPLFL